MWNSTEGIVIINPKTKDIIYDVSKKEIINCDISKIIELINHMENVIGFVKSNEKLNICFSGYDEDPREIYNIPEIRIYMNKLVNEKPYLPYFLTKDKNTRVLVMSCVCDVEILKTENNINNLSIRMPKDISLVIITGLTLVAKKYGIPIPKMQESMRDMPF